MKNELEILLSTINEGIFKVHNVLLPERLGVKYIISHQYTDNKYNLTPSELERSDVVVSHIYGRGVTQSRNHAINLSQGNIAIFSDDDVTYEAEYFNTVLETFVNNPAIDIAIFKIKTLGQANEYKDYPSDSFKLEKLPFSIGTIEIAFRVEVIKNSQIRFDERFGAGQKLLIGSDESIFISDCLKKGLNIWYFPKYIVNHPFDSHTKVLPKYDKKRNSVTGAYDARINGWISIPKAFLGTIKYLPDLIKNHKNPIRYFKDRLFAALYIVFTRPNI